MKISEALTEIGILSHSLGGRNLMMVELKDR